MRPGPRPSNLLSEALPYSWREQRCEEQLLIRPLQRWIAPLSHDAPSHFAGALDGGVRVLGDDNFVPPDNEIRRLPDAALPNRRADTNRYLQLIQWVMRACSDWRQAKTLPPIFWATATFCQRQSRLCQASMFDAKTNAPCGSFPKQKTHLFSRTLSLDRAVHGGPVLAPAGEKLLVFRLHRNINIERLSN